jgi:hypothetical protein
MLCGSACRTLTEGRVRETQTAEMRLLRAAERRRIMDRKRDKDMTGELDITDKSAVI